MELSKWIRFAPAVREVSAGVIAIAAVTAVGVFNASLAKAQSKTEPGIFEVATIKLAAAPAVREGGNRSRIEHAPNRLSMWNVNLSECVQWAYGVEPFQVSAAHPRTEAYDIAAKAPDSVTVSQLRMMLRDLLTKRFKLALHHETRMLPVYELVVAKGGPKLPAAHANTSPPVVRAVQSLPRVQNDSFLFADASMAEFVGMLAKLRGIDLPVVDRTGIAGTFDIELKSGPSLAREGDTAGLLSLLPAQLGLKLAVAKAPFDIIVIDHSEKPSEN